MGRNEIKMNRKMVSPEQVHRYRNYSLLLKQYKRKERLKRAIKIFAYSVLITLVTVLFIVIISWMMFR
jgi:hypothetical protein